MPNRIKDHIYSLAEIWTYRAARGLGKEFLTAFAQSGANGYVQIIHLPVP
jgi:hypothetical protein